LEAASVGFGWVVWRAGGVAGNVVNVVVPKAKRPALRAGRFGMGCLRTDVFGE
jgi:hypothetical protein